MDSFLSVRSMNQQQMQLAVGFYSRCGLLTPRGAKLSFWKGQKFKFKYSNYFLTQFVLMFVD